MKNNILKYFILLLSVLLILVVYLSTIGIETDKFKAITADELINLSAEKVYSEIKKDLDLID